MRDEFLKIYEDVIWKLFPVKDIVTNALGLVSEAGEFGNLIKKEALYKSNVPKEDKLSELADVVWHIAQCSRLLGSNLEEVIGISLKKTLEKNNVDDLNIMGMKEGIN